MEVVILRELMSSYASTWVTIANTSDAKKLRQGDVFREVGFGEGAEEMKVEVFDLSPVAGASKMLVQRAYRGAPQSYRVGAVLARVEAPVKVAAPPPAPPPSLLDDEPELVGAVAGPEPRVKRKYTRRA